MASASQSAPPAPRLYLVTPEIRDPSGATAALTDALKAADVAAVLVRLAEADERTLIKHIKALAPVIQDHGAALILHGRADLVARSGADGAHLTGIAAFNEAVETLKPDWIAGCGGLTSRHDAMLAAEGAADYLMFGEPDSDGHRPASDAIAERVQWWAEVFQIPCIGFAASLDEVAEFSRLGAEFVAVSDLVWSDSRGPAAAVREITSRLMTPEPVS